MNPDQRMQRDERPGAAAVPAWLALAGVVAGGLVDGLEVVDQGADLGGQPVIGRHQAGEEGVAAIGRDLDAVEDRVAVRVGDEGDVDVPSLVVPRRPGAGRAGVVGGPALAIFVDAPLPDLGMVLKPLGDRMGGGQGAEGAAESLELVVAQVLVPEEHDPPPVQGVLDLLEGRRVDGPAEVDAGNLRADGRGHRLDDDPGGR